MDNQFSSWYPNQTVTALQMNQLTEDIYSKFTYLTETNSPMILNLGGNITEGGGNVNLPAGSFRFASTAIPYLPYDTGIIGNAAAATVAVTGNGWVVARYSVNPAASGSYTYTFPTTYVFTSSTPLITDCIICIITAGVITGYGNFAVQNLFTYDGGENTINISTLFGLNPNIGFSVTNSGATNTMTSTGAEWNLISSNNPTAPTTGTFARIATFYSSPSPNNSEAFMAAGIAGVENQRLDLYAGTGSAYRLAYSQLAGYAPPTVPEHVLVYQDAGPTIGTLSATGSLVSGSYTAYSICGTLLEIRMNALIAFNPDNYSAFDLITSTFSSLPFPIPAYGKFVAVTATIGDTMVSLIGTGIQNVYNTSNAGVNSIVILGIGIGLASQNVEITIYVTLEL